MEGGKLARPSALRELWANVKESLLGFKRVYGWIEIGVKDMGRAIKWYCGAFRLERVTNGSDPERVHLGRDSGNGAKHTMIPLVPIREGRTEPKVDRHPILYTKRLEKLYADCFQRNSSVADAERFEWEPVFSVEGSEGNRMEMCLQPGWETEKQLGRPAER